jgi:hypothetical protein
MPVDMMWLGIALLLAPALGEIAKIRAKADKGFAWMAAAGALFLLAAAFGADLSVIGIGATQMAYGTAIFSVIGLIAALIGAIWVAISLLK